MLQDEAAPSELDDDDVHVEDVELFDEDPAYGGSGPAPRGPGAKRKPRPVRPRSKL